MSITIQLHKFEGPLALLLYLIRKEEMDIFDIKINEITNQYLEYIKLMKELDLELAGEFIAMAASLLQIKSRMLLPQYGENGEVIEQEDPRKELVQRLLEYQKYQEASKQLYERPLLGRDVWSRGLREKLEVKDEEIELEENALFALISAYRKALRSIRKRVHQVAARTQSIASRILQIKDRLIVGTRVALSDLIDNVAEKKKEVLITFLSALELAKLGFVSLYQTDTYQEIWIEAKQPIVADAVSRVEEYDSMRADDIALDMMSKAMKLDEVAADEFVMPDEKDEVQMELAEGINPEDMASDEEILAAEIEMQQNMALSDEPKLDGEIV
jgi:segregation and condensation protein A